MLIFQEPGEEIDDPRLNNIKKLVEVLFRLVEIFHAGDLGKLTPWEIDFLNAISENVFEGREFSERDVVKLKEIRDKVL